MVIDRVESLGQGPSPPIAKSGWVASCRKSLGGGHCVLGDLQCCRNVLVPFPRSVPRHNPVSVLYGQFLDNSFDLMAWFLLCNARSTMQPYLDRRVPFQIMSNQLNLPQVDSNQVVETSEG
uniref:Uncharacterized protein n=1 Tax=Schistosoma japonicum TaxID=6182 RepID=Q86DV2_SCHJA|nr:hypothetical protein [Schistosoma japonicum]